VADINHSALFLMQIFQQNNFFAVPFQQLNTIVLCGESSVRALPFSQWLPRSHPIRTPFAAGPVTVVTFLTRSPNPNQFFETDL
jgi:hypothetical protein